MSPGMAIDAIMSDRLEEGLAETFTEEQELRDARRYINLAYTKMQHALMWKMGAVFLGLLAILAATGTGTPTFAVYGLLAAVGGWLRSVQVKSGAIETQENLITMAHWQTIQTKCVTIWLEAGKDVPYQGQQRTCTKKLPMGVVLLQRPIL